MLSRLLRRLIGLRLSNHNLSFSLYALWTVMACLALITLPTYLRLDLLAWELPAQQMLLLYLLGAAYIMYSLILYFAATGGRGINLYLAVVIGALCFLLFAGGLRFLEGLEFSRAVLVGSMVLGVAFAIYPFLLHRRMFLLSGAFLLLLLIGVAALVQSRPTVVQQDTVEQLISSRYVLDKASYPIIPDNPGAEGGAIAAYGDGFIAVTGDGIFYRLSWSEQGDTLVADKLPLVSPLAGRDTFFENKARSGLQFRVTDLLIQHATDGDYLLVAHQIWNQSDNCFLMGVSRAPLPAGPVAGEADSSESWQSIYKTHPCIEQPFDTVETGGRLAWAGDTLLMTVGDHGKDGRMAAALAQDPEADYGKVLALDLQGGAEVLTSGHRNPQGLLVDQSGQIWATEHGPAGGDEINLLVAGSNYGWPLVTYGTEYSKRIWPLNPDGRDHGGFSEPIHAFVPAVAISNLIQVGDRQFPRWEGDFLIGSLRKETLYRVRIRDNRVIYVEPIFLGKRVRDLVEGSDGRIVVWSDDESVTVLSRRLDSTAGEDTFEQCRICHEPVGKAKAIAPDLKGILGRKIASRRDFNYSPGLKAVDGVWSEQRLMEFLESPQQFAPGTMMGSNGVPDETDRAAVIEYLKTYGATGQ